MARTIQQAEAELRVAALEYAEAHEVYSRAFDRNHDDKRYEGLKNGEQPGPLHPETQAAVRISCQKQNAMCAAAGELREAIRSEQRAEAL